MINALIATGIHLFILLGPLLILALIMNPLSRLNERFGCQLFGRNGYLYGFRWLGTAVHELGHALFALLFGHRVTEVVLFDPNPVNGSLGYVRHSYKPGNPFHEVGNFFIGIGPVLMGSMMLYLVAFLLFRVKISDLNSALITSETITNLSSLTLIGKQVLAGFLNFYQHVFSGSESTWWKIILMVYLLYSIGSSITLSPADLNAVLRGFLYFVILLLFFNLGTLWIGNFATTVLSKASAFFSGFYFLMILSIIISAIFALVLVSIRAVVGIVK